MQCVITTHRNSRIIQNTRCKTWLSVARTDGSSFLLIFVSTLQLTLDRSISETLNNFFLLKFDPKLKPIRKIWQQAIKRESTLEFFKYLSDPISEIKSHLIKECLGDRMSSSLHLLYVHLWWSWPFHICWTIKLMYSDEHLLLCWL